MALVLRAALTFIFTFSALAQASVNPSKKYLDYEAAEAYKYKILAKNQSPFLFRPASSAATDTHVMFESSEEAIQWFERISGFMEEIMGSRLSVLPASDSRYPILQAEVHQIWKAFQELFPEQTQGLNEPPVVLVKSDMINAFVSGHMIEEGKIAHAIVIFTGLLDAEGDKKFVTGVLGHEIAHSVFRHLIPEVGHSINKFYNTRVDRFGYKANHDTEVEQAMAVWQESALFAGDLTNSELMDLPSIGSGRSILLQLWVQALSGNMIDPQQCGDFRDAFSSWMEFQKFVSFSKAFEISSSDLPKVEAASESLISENRKCSVKKVGFISLLAKVLSVSESALEGTPEIVAVAAEYDAAATPAEGLQKIVAPFRQAMVEIESSLDFKNLGLFNAEEHADDISLIVHRQLGWDEDALTNFFDEQMNDDDRGACNSAISSGNQIPNGAFSAPHRADCYRMNHLHEMKSEIGSDAKSFAKSYLDATL